MDTKINFAQKCVVFITGASRGIGQTIAVELANLVMRDSLFVLIARSEVGLNETKSAVNAINPDISMLVCVLDLSKAKEDSYKRIFDETVKKINGEDFKLSVFFHNAGQVGTLTNAVNIADFKTYQDFFELNHFSSCIMTSFYLTHIKNYVNKIAVVNISSLAGSVPFKNMSLYCAAKAARNLYFKVLALEEQTVVVLNYSPGPVQTEMFETVIQKAHDEEVKLMFLEQKLLKKVLDPKTTVLRLINILREGHFTSGDVIDYFDAESGPS